MLKNKTEVCLVAIYDYQNLKFWISDWMDSATQCSLNNVFDVGTSTSTIYGKAAVQTNPGSLTECSITLRTGIPREKRRFSVEIVSGNVNEPGVQFTMYDGSDTGSNRLVISSTLYFLIN